MQIKNGGALINPLVFCCCCARRLMAWQIYMLSWLCTEGGCHFHSLPKRVGKLLNKHPSSVPQSHSSWPLNVVPVRKLNADMMALDDTTYCVNLKGTDGDFVVTGVSQHFLWYWRLSVCEQITRETGSSTQELAMFFDLYRRFANDIVVEEEAKCSTYCEWNWGISL
jgi:hypothetical protein